VISKWLIRGCPRKKSKHGDALADCWNLPFPSNTPLDLLKKSRIMTDEIIKHILNGLEIQAGLDRRKGEYTWSPTKIIN
jgi:hypothetical protein